MMRSQRSSVISSGFSTTTCLPALGRGDGRLHVGARRRGDDDDVDVLALEHGVEVGDGVASRASARRPSCAALAAGAADERDAASSRAPRPGRGRGSGRSCRSRRWRSRAWQVSLAVGSADAKRSDIADSDRIQRVGGDASCFDSDLRSVRRIDRIGHCIAQTLVRLPQHTPATGTASRSAPSPPACRRPGRRARVETRSATPGRRRWRTGRAHCSTILILPSQSAPNVAPRFSRKLRRPVMTSSRATTTVTIHGAASPASSTRQQEDERPADEHLVHERVEVAAQRAGQALLAGEVAVEPVGDGGRRRRRRRTAIHSSNSIRTNSTTASTSRAAVSWLGRLKTGGGARRSTVVAMHQHEAVLAAIDSPHLADGAADQVVAVGGGDLDADEVARPAGSCP